VLYSFCSQKKNGPCTDGSGPSGLIVDASGHLYGTTTGGGANCQSNNLPGCGTVFELTPNAARTKLTETVLYSFCTKATCIDGRSPHYAGLIMDGSGNLYGTTTFGGGGSAHLRPTTSIGGTSDAGVVFELIPNPARTKWIETVLYSFCTEAGCTDGNNPYAGLIMDGSGNLYGTTNLGGTHNGGTVFELTPNAARTKWTETVLYSFCTKASRFRDTAGRYFDTCIDGWAPYGPLIMDGSGNLYGTTPFGGATNAGVVFELIPNAARTTWTETVLHNFCADAAHRRDAAGGRALSPNCADGNNPYAGLTMDGSGNLYGTSSKGGSQRLITQGSGTVFELAPNAARTRWTETILYSFCAESNCIDGAYPHAGLITHGSGHLYGTTFAGIRAGTVFELTPNAARTKWTETVLHSFCAESNCIDGAYPHAGLIMDGSGHLYGTTNGGGAHYRGTVFELKP
jgi:uncharacterized repeat protein (TIGR03803 family)